MNKKEFIVVWIIGILLCIENIVFFTTFEAMLYAFVFPSLILCTLSILRTDEGKNIYCLVRKTIKQKV